MILIVRLEGLGFYDSCSTHWHILAAGTMSNLTVYNVIPLDVLISPDRDCYALVVWYWLHSQR